MKNIPKLRFKEFSGEWEKKKLGEILNIFNGYAFSSKNNIDSGIILLKIANVGINKMKKEEMSFLPLDFFNLYSKYILKKGDIVIALTRPILNGKLKISEIDDFFHNSLLNQRVGKLLTKENIKFIYNLLQNKNYIKKIENNIAGSDPPNLSTESIKDIIVIFPKIKEQQKIADFLSSVDKKISITEEKLDLFKDYKKGIMQKIFKQELRFKDNEGNNYPEWEEKRLEEISSFINGKGHEQFIDENGNYIVVNSKFISSDGSVKKYTSNLLVPLYVNDILMVMSDVPNGKAIGKCFLVNENNKYSLNQRICALRTVENSKYLYYFLNRNSYFLKFDDGISQTNLKKDEVLSCPIFLPCLEEQQKIADFLSSIDNKIDKITTELENLKEFKKGLLQQMFV